MSGTPRLLTIAGSDSGGGAGIQADLKTFAAHRCYGMSVLTAVTAQNTRAVRAVHEIPPEIVEAQIDAVFDDIGADAVKIGMLSSAPIIRVVAAGLRRHRPAQVVLDPVMVAKSGDALLADEAVDALVIELVPLATLLTPNLPETSRLLAALGGPADLPDEAGRRAAARRLAGEGPMVLVKGGHGEGEELVDVLYDGEGFHRFARPRIISRSTHGTGCTLSSAIAARLARGDAPAAAVEGAINYLRGAIAAAHPLGSGHGPVDHLYALIPRSPRADAGDSASPIRPRDAG